MSRPRVRKDLGAPVGEEGFGIPPHRFHAAEKCRGHACCIHAPSEHHMRDWPLNRRSDTGVMERLCTHGVGHPDPDHIAYVEGRTGRETWQRTHGCDGCCTPSDSGVRT